MTIYNVGLNTGNTGSITATTLDKGNPATPSSRVSGVNVGCVAGFATIARMVFDVVFPVSGAGTVTGATLKIRNADAVSPAATYELRSINTAFTFAQTTWNSRLTGTTWGVSGALTGVEVDASVIATGLAPTAGGDTNFDITGAGLDAWVQGCLNGSITNKQLILSKIDDTTVAESARRRFRSDVATDGLRPILTFDFAPSTPPDITISDVTVSTASGTASFTVSLSSTYGTNVTVNYATADQTASAGSDYRSASGTLTFAPGETSKKVTVDIINDGTITPLVVTNRASANDTGVAPFAVQFDATGTTSTLTTRPFHDLYHSWNFGDDDTVTWGYGTQAGVAKKNRASGPIAAHVYETPGVYTVQYSAIDPLTGSIAMTTKTITVTDPDVVFSGTNTICVDNGATPVNGVNGVPADAAVSNQTTWAGVIALMATGKRILLKKGATWNCGAGNGAFNVAGPGIVGSYGSGAKPKILLTAASAYVFTPGALAQDWRIMDLEGDATGLATGVARNGTRFFSASDGNPTTLGTVTSGRYCTLLRITHSNSGSLAHCGNDNTVVDCVADNLNGGGGNVSYFTQYHENISILGCSSQVGTAGEHNLRLQGTQKTVIAHCTFTVPATNKHALTLRGYAASGTNLFEDNYTEKVVISNNELIGSAASAQTVTISPQAGTYDERFRDVIFERNYVTAEQNYGYSLVTNGGQRLTVRNNLTRLKAGAYGAIIANGSSWAGNGNAIIPPVDHAYYNNTTYASDTIGHGVDAINVNTAVATGMLFYNNIAYTPAYSGTKKNLNITAGSTYTEGTNSSNAQMGSTTPNFTATPPTTYAEWKPTSGYPVNGGTTVPVYDDFFGVQRTYPTADMGAVNP